VVKSKDVEQRIVILGAGYFAEEVADRWKFATMVHPSAQVSATTRLGEGSIVGTGVVIRDLPEDSYWSLAGISGAQLCMNSLAIAIGGGVRVGLEDNIYYDPQRTRLATASSMISAMATSRTIPQSLGNGMPMEVSAR
jgi:uncharacterized protein (DUF849 family)